MVDCVVESGEFALGIRCVKIVYMVAGVESGKDVERKQLDDGHFNPSDPIFFCLIC